MELLNHILKGLYIRISNLRYIRDTDKTIEYRYLELPYSLSPELAPILNLYTQFVPSVLVWYHTPTGKITLKIYTYEPLINKVYGDVYHITSSLIRYHQTVRILLRKRRKLSGIPCHSGKASRKHLQLVINTLCLLMHKKLEVVPNAPGLRPIYDYLAQFEGMPMYTSSSGEWKLDLRASKSKVNKAEFKKIVNGKVKPIIR